MNSPTSSDATSSAKTRPTPTQGADICQPARLRITEFEAGWAAIARDGERLGYVPAEALLKMQ